jgi:hypothetical protein
LTLTMIRWRDACSVEANSVDPIAAVPELSELITTGWLLAEDEQAVLVGMELQADDTRPGRWRFNVPKSGIIERRDIEIGRGFCVRRKGQ